MPTPFKRSLRFVRRWEGGWSDHPDDRGGATQYGITLATYTNWRRSQGLPDPSAADLRAITEEEVEAIYQQNYWDACRCDELPPPIALLVFDITVNAGPSRSIRLLQEALGVSVDGIIGPETLGAARAADPQEVAAEFTARRSLYYASLSTFKTFGLGWLRRTADALSTATVMATRSPALSPSLASPDPIEEGEEPLERKSPMGAYRKLVIAIVGLAIMLAHRHLGLDLSGQEEMIVDMVIAGLTAVGVWGLPNETQPDSR